MADVTPHPVTAQQRFQFSVRMLLIVTAFIAVAVAVSLAYYRGETAGQRAILLVQAIQNGNVKEVDQLLKADPRLAHGREHGTAWSSHTALQNALVRMHPANGSKVIDRILQEKPDVNERSADGETALQVAAALNRLSEVQRLIRLGADLNAMDDRGQTPLHMALRSDSTGKVLKLLLNAGADPNISPPARSPPDWRQPLHTAAESGNAGLVTLLLDAGAQVNAPDTKGRTALHMAVADDHLRLDIATLLMEGGADMTAKDADGLIPGERNDGSNSAAAVSIWWDKIARLVEQNKLVQLDQLLDVAPQVLNFRADFTPQAMIHRALLEKRLDVLDYLLKRLDPESRAARAQSLLPYTCSSDLPVEFTALLIDAGADIHVKYNFGQTSLRAAARGHRHDVIRLLVARGARNAAIDAAGASAIDAAFESQFYHPEGRQTLELLRQAGLPPTVLYSAATGDIGMLRKLTGDSLESLNRAYTRNGVRPLHAAVLGKQPDVIKWLFANGVNREPPSPADWGRTTTDTPLMIALSYNLTDIAILLIENGASVNRKGSNDYYPAHAVIQSGRDPRILEALLAHGADPSLQYQGKSVTQMAVEATYGNRARYLELLNAAANKSAAGR